MLNHTDNMPESATAYILGETCEQSHPSPTIHQLHEESLQYSVLFEEISKVIEECPDQVFRAFSISLNAVSTEDPDMVGLLADEFENLTVLITRLVYMRQFIKDKTAQLIDLSEALELKAKEAIVNG